MGRGHVGVELRRLGVRAGENVPEGWMGTTGAVLGRHMGICGQYLDWLSDYDWIVECVGAMGYRGDGKAGLEERGGIIAAPKPGWWLGLDGGLVT